MVKIEIKENEAGQRLDRFLRKYLARAPLSAIYRIIRKDLKVNGKRGREDQVLVAGDQLTFYLSEEQFQAFAKPVKKRAARRQFGIVYEDEQVLIVNKPKGLLTHGDATEKKNTLVNQVCGYLQEKGEYDPSEERTFTPSPVNRLDRNTTGLVIFGKTAAALRVLTAQLRQKDQIKKYYMAIVKGTLNEEMFIDDSLRKDAATNRVSVSQDVDHAKAARTRVRPLAAGTKFSLVEVELITGRTHQIRVHLAGRGYPLAGDAKYGDPSVNEALKKQHITSQLLHACRLSFCKMPEPLEALSEKTVTAPPPKAFQEAGKELIDVGISFV